MTPSEKYSEVTEFTIGTDNVFKRTNKTVAELFPLNNKFDSSITYTQPENPSKDYLTAMYTTGGKYGTNFNTYTPYTTVKWKASASATSDTTRYIGQVTHEESAGISNVKVGIAYMSNGNQYANYRYGASELATEPDEYSGSYWKSTNSWMITEFETNKAILKFAFNGWTQEEIDDYINNDVVTARHSINISDFMANPDNYYVGAIQDISVVPYDDKNSSNPWPIGDKLTIKPVLLINGENLDAIQSIENAFGGFTSGNSSFGLGSNTILNGDDRDALGSSETQVKFSLGDIGKYAKEMTNTGNAYSKYMFSKPLSFSIRPAISENTSDYSTYEVGTYLMDKQVQDYGNHLVFTAQRMQMTNDYSTATTTHISHYYIERCAILKGRALYDILAHCGIYVYGSDNFSNDMRSVTPENISKSANIYLGEMNDSGFTTGRFITGEELKKYKGPNKEGSSIHNEFIPGSNKPFSNEDKVVDMGYNETIINTANAFRKLYAISSDDLTSINLALNNNDNWDSDSSSEHKIPTGFDPMQSIIGLSAFPWDITTGAISASGISSNVQIGRWNTGISATKLVSGTCSWYDLGSTFISPRIQDSSNGEFNFLNYAPYTQVYVYVPYCGELELPTNLVMNHTISVRVLYDIVTGSIKAVIKSTGWDTTDGGIIVGEISGQISSSMSISSNGESMRKSALISSSINSVGSVAASIGGVATSNPVAAVGGAISALGAITQTISTANKNFSSTKGSSDPMTEFMMPNQCYIKTIYTKPVGDGALTSSQYRVTVGAITAQAMRFNNMTNNSYFVAQNPNLDGLTATESEKDHIRQILTTGFFA